MTDEQLAVVNAALETVDSRVHIEAVHFHGDNSRLNIGSIDLSVNVVEASTCYGEDLNANDSWIDQSDKDVLKLLCDHAVKTNAYRVAPHEVYPELSALGINESQFQEALEVLSSAHCIYEQCGLDLVILSTTALTQYFEVTLGDRPRFLVETANAILLGSMETAEDLARYLRAPQLRVWHALNQLEDAGFIRTIQSRIDADATISAVRASLRRWARQQPQGE